jgi:hypothetical protein
MFLFVSIDMFTKWMEAILVVNITHDAIDMFTKWMEAMLVVNITHDATVKLYRVLYSDLAYSNGSLYLQGAV